MAKISRSRAVALVAGIAIAVGAFDSARPAQKPHSFGIGLLDRGEINTLDPAEAGTEAPTGILWNIYDRLVQFDPQNQLTARLAESWAANSDMTEWRFRIRSNVRFHGKGFGADRILQPSDVKASIERAVKSPGYGRSLISDIVRGADDFIDGKTQDIGGITIDGQDVVFHLSEPFRFLPDRLATSFMSIVPAGAAIEGALPAGTGAYDLVSWDKVAGVVNLERSSKAWRPAPPSAPSSVTIRAYTTAVLAASDLANGSIDILDFNSSAADIVRKAAANLHVSQYVHNEIRLIGLNQKVAPFNGPDAGSLGQALNLAIDRVKLVGLLGGGEPFGGPVPTKRTETFAFGFDAVRARSLVSRLPEASRHLAMLVEPVDEARFIAEWLVSQLRAVGLYVRVVPGQADFWDQVIAGNYQMALAYYSPFVPTPEQYLWMYRSRAIPIPNAMQYRNSDFEAAFKRYVTLFDEVPHDQALDLALKVLLQSSPAVWIAVPPRFTAYRGARVSLDRSGGLPDYSTIVRQSK